MRISYVCLIYKSVKYLKFLYEQFNKYTKLKDGDEFYFVANDATEEVLNYLSNNNFPHYIHNNTEEQRKEYAKDVPMKRFGKVVEVAHAVLFFASNFIMNAQTKPVRLIVRGDDMGFSHAGNLGLIESYKNGIEKSEAKELLVRHSLFDTFKKENRVSYAFRLIFQSMERTLTDEEINKVVNTIYSSLKENGWEVR